MRLSLKHHIVFLFALLIVFIAYVYNLHIMPLIADEPTRAIVSYEMYLNNSWFAPTINGEPYLNKPPLFNHWIGTWIHLFGGLNEFMLRLQAIFFLFLSSIIVYIYGYHFFRWKVALLSAIGFLTCSRILFYDSTLGYIDPFFTFIILLQLLGSTRYYLIENWLMFYLTITLTSLIGYFLKGLPGIAFGVITILSLYLWERQWKLLWTPYILISIIFGTGVIYLYYFKINTLSISDSSSQIINQSLQRYENESILKSLTHLITFPFQLVFNFSPWALLWLYLLIQYKYVITKLSRHQMTLMVVSFSNLILYWMSTETRPRYLFMFVAIFFLVGYSIYLKHFYSGILNSLLHKSLLFIAPVLFTIPLFYWFGNRFDNVDNYLLNGIIISVSVMIAATILYLHHKKWSVWTITFTLLIYLKIILQGMFLPLRVYESPESQYKKWGYEIASIVQDNHVQITQYTPINQDISFYIIQKTNIPLQVVPIKTLSTEYVLTSNVKDLNQPFEILRTYPLPFENYKMYLIKIQK
ncbi:MAG: hypothetical protein U0U66_11035 [Cytophagaceae bacterium]